MQAEEGAPSVALSQADNHPQLSAQTDSQLVASCLLGQESAWEALITRYNPLIYSIPLRFGFSRPVADEIFQEICLFLLEKLDTLRDHERLHPWLVTVTRRMCIQRIRKVKATRVVDDSIDAVESYLDPDTQGIGSIDEEIMLLEQCAQIRHAIDRLSPRCRQLIDALFFEDDKPSYEIIAENLNIPVGSVGPTRARCLEKLRHELTNLAGNIQI